MKELGLLKEIYDLTRPCVVLTETPVRHGRIRSFDSKLGGRPYLPNLPQYRYPIAKTTGQPLHLLMQINLTEMPFNAPNLQTMPRRGLLQFFIDFDDDLLSLETGDYAVQFVDFADTNQGAFDNAQNLDALPISEGRYSPIDGEFGLTGRLINQPPTFAAIDWLQLFKEYRDAPDFDDCYALLAQPTKHQIGGYPDCCQEERFSELLDDADDYLLLLQLTSTAHVGFGDGGVANFFVREADLKRRDFSKVRFTWDCF